MTAKDTTSFPPGNADAVIRSLTDPAPIKVWSYLATIFGDLARAPGDEIGGRSLSALTERAGIRPEAMRVALHRLRRDGWIVARKAGRNSLYRLSERGLSETLRASRRIYARTVDRPGLWHLLLADPAANALPPSVEALPGREDYLKVSGTILLGAGPCPSSLGDVLTLEFARMTPPPWLLRKVVPEDGEEVYGRTAELLTATARALDRAALLPPLDRATIRLLALHHWRRAVLRHSPLAEMLHDEGWAGAVCRDEITGILDRLPRPAVETLPAGIQAVNRDRAGQVGRGGAGDGRDVPPTMEV